MEANDYMLNYWILSSAVYIQTGRTLGESFFKKMEMCSYNIETLFFITLSCEVLDLH